MTIRSQVSSIMGVIGLKQLELFALEFEKLLYFTLFTLYIYTVASTNIDQLVPKLVNINMSVQSHRSFIKDVIGPEQVELFTLE